MWDLTPGNELMEGYLRDRARRMFNGSRTAGILNGRGYAAETLYENDFDIPDASPEEVEANG